MTLIEQILLDIVKTEFSDVDITTLSLDTPPKKELGDFAYEVFSLAKSTRLAPPVIADRLAEAINARDEYFSDASVMGGYVNFRLTARAWGELFASLQTKGGEKKGETIVVDYIGLNIGKPSHIGHICTVSIGQSIANLHDHLGYNVITDNHLGDWGWLFGKLIAGYKRYGDATQLHTNAIEHLLDVYVKITADAEKDEAVEESCRNEFKKLSEGDAENIELWKTFTTYSLEKSQELNNILQAKTRYTIGESFYEGLPLPKIGDHPNLQFDMKSVVQELVDKGIATKNEDGSVGVIFPEESKIPSCILAKRDGTHGYLASDLATIKYRATNGWDPRKIFICADMRQQLHFKQCFWTAKAAWPELLNSVDLYHVWWGFIKLKEGAMSTRKGTIIRLQDLINEGFSRTKSIIESKWQSLADADIQAIAVGAIKYSYLAQDREKDVVFDWDKTLAFEGNSGPYIQYACVRAKNIVAKTKESNLTPALSTSGEGAITTPLLHVMEKGLGDEVILSDHDRSCLRQLSFFERAVADSATKYKPHILALYCYDLAVAFNSFYVHTPKILEEQDENLRSFRLALIAKTHETLAKGFELLAIPMPEKM